MKGYRASSGGDENILNLECDDEFIILNIVFKTLHCILWMNIMICELHINKDVTKY